MPYRLIEEGALQQIGNGKSTAERIESALNLLESEGWSLMHLVAQRRAWDEDHEFAGWAETAFIFHRPVSS